jgi:hypothetical protein
MALPRPPAAPAAFGEDLAVDGVGHPRAPVVHLELDCFGAARGKMPKGGPETVLKIDQDFVASMKGKTADLSKSYTNTFANAAQ